MLITCSAKARLPFRIPVMSYLLINTCVGKYRFLYILDVSGTTVMTELLKAFVPLIIPLPMNFYFDIFDGLIQAYVFVFLTALFMTEEQE